MRKRLIILFVVLSLLVSALVGCDKSDEQQKLNSYKSYSFSYFDTVSTIIGYEESEEKFGEVSKKALDLLGEYHKLFDIYNEYEGINNLCTINKLVDGEHQVVKVDRKIIDMLLYAKEMHTVTGGEMNVAMGSVLSIWHEYRTAGIDNPSEAELPPMDMLAAAAEHTDINDVIIDEENSTVWLSDPEMKLDVGAFAKGYAVEMVARMLEEDGKTGYAVNVGGNIRTVGKKADGNKWKTGVENPAEDPDVPYIEYIGLESNAIVTSGSYQRYYLVAGNRYHHIIDPDTLMPAEGLLSVSVICTDSGMGDGLSTALFCMSIEDGMALINSLDGVEAMWVGEDETKYYSSGFSNYFFEENVIDTDDDETEENGSAIAVAVIFISVGLIFYVAIYLSRKNKKDSEKESARISESKESTDAPENNTSIDE